MSEQPLRRELLANAAFSTLSGGTFVLFGPAVADLIGIGIPLVYQIIGLGLLVFAGYVLWIATRKTVDTFAVLQISLGDFLWVMGTLVVILLTLPSLHWGGLVAMLLVAAVVLRFGIGQLNGISKAYAIPNKHNTHRICVAIDTPEPADKLWPIIADLPSIREYSPHLETVILREDTTPGVGAVRQCTDDKGKTWAEHCTRYDHDARALDMHFLADEPGFPYPFQTMDGGWEVVPNGNGSTVNIWFEVTPKNRWTHPIILAMMTKNLASNFGDVVARMTATARGEAIPTIGVAPQFGISAQIIPCY